MSEPVGYESHDVIISSWKHGMWFSLYNAYSCKYKLVKVLSLGERKELEHDGELSKGYSFTCIDQDGWEMEVTIWKRPKSSNKIDWSADVRGAAWVDHWQTPALVISA